MSTTDSLFDIADIEFDVYKLLPSTVTDQLTLCGSRYFNQKYPDIISFENSNNRDYDFFAQYSDELVQLLEQHGFYNVKAHSQYPFDDLAISILIHPSYQCQVILRKDAEKYKRVIERIKPEFYRDYLWKSGPNAIQKEQIMAIFNQLFAMAE